MGHHIDSEGRFQSDKHPELPPDRIILSFADPEARDALKWFGMTTKDRELGDDVLERVETITQEGR